MEKKDKNKTPKSFMIAFYVVIAIAVTLIIVLSSVSSRRRSVEYLSEYTYVKEESAESLSKMSVVDEASDWIKGYLSQYTGTFVAKNKRISNITFEKIEEVEDGSGIINVVFNAKLSDFGTEFFSEWNPSYSGDRIYCDWNLKLGVKNINEKTKGLYVVELEKNSYSKANIFKSQNNDKKVTNTAFIKYKINEGRLSISFDDGATYREVPVDVNGLVVDEKDNTLLKTESYSISNDIVAFLCKEKDNVTGQEHLLVMTTTDGGVNWKVEEIGVFRAPSYVYVNAFSQDEILVAVECIGDDNTNECRIFAKKSKDAGFEQTGIDKRNRTVKEISFTDPDTGYVAYIYNSGDETNLYRTDDMGASFKEVILPNGDLDQTAEGKVWKEIYKEAKAPKSNEKNEIVLYLTQGDNATYHGGKTAAKYISKDNGETWELETETEDYS